MTGVRCVEELAAVALDGADDDIFEAAELLSERLDDSDLDARVVFASDYSTTVEVEGVQYDVDWFARRGPWLTPMRTGAVR